jgi:hypothetical protein
MRTQTKIGICILLGLISALFGLAFVMASAVLDSGLDVEHKMFYSIGGSMLLLIAGNLIGVGSSIKNN